MLAVNLNLQELKRRYERDGYLVVENFLPPGLLRELREVTVHFLERGRAGELSGALFDVYESGGVRNLRRIVDPDKVDPVYDRAMRMDAMVDLVAHLLGGSARFDHAKLNFKPPATGGAEVEWHQDWAFYPQTNDDMLAVGVMLEDCTERNGPLMVIPGSHRGPVYDHHQNGRFIGGIPVARLGDAVRGAVALTAPAGSISVHHVRTLHASGANLGERNRPLLLYNYAAVDAFPVFHSYPWPDFNARILRGEETVIPRMKQVPARIPQPTQKSGDGYTTDSLFTLQKEMQGGAFDKA